MERTWRYAVGVSYTPPDSRWVFRSGFAYDQTPIPNAQLRPARIPDNDRYWVTAGVSYALPHNIRLHGAYAYLFVPTAAIDSKGATADHLMGKFSSHYHIVGVQLDWRF
ncbi:putative outer membrane protein [Nitrosomonas stercoris]|uniref:Putative outer membrane protein n=1 Tax=Nitrosomonas stercoris TaxID=1444684 RepID=A0A4Y1YMK2_9PROT|nr:putative outer membrane protein [Nitrosomonas stercoris]